MEDKISSYEARPQILKFLSKILLLGLVAITTLVSQTGLEFALSHEGSTASLDPVPKIKPPRNMSVGEYTLIRGAAEYRQCYYCHSLQAGVHLTGPSLANLWGKPAGRVSGYTLYSPALVTSATKWNTGTLKKWLANPKAMIPGNLMTFKGVTDIESIEALVEFLKIAMAPDGFNNVQKKNLVDRETAAGQRPKDLSKPAANAHVTELSHCGSTYRLVTADGGKQDYWEHNIQLMVDSSETGPPPGKPVRLEAGSMGDRFAIVFHDPREALSFVKTCPARD